MAVSIDEKLNPCRTLSFYFTQQRTTGIRYADDESFTQKAGLLFGIRLRYLLISGPAVGRKQHKGNYVV